MIIFNMVLNSTFSKVSYYFWMLNKQKGENPPPIIFVATTEALQNLQNANGFAAWYTLGEREKDIALVAERKKGHY